MRLSESFNATKLVAKFYRQNVRFVRKTVTPFGRLRGNICDSSLARWKACGRLSIGYN